LAFSHLFAFSPTSTRRRMASGRDTVAPLHPHLLRREALIGDAVAEPPFDKARFNPTLVFNHSGARGHCECLHPARVLQELHDLPLGMVRDFGIPTCLHFPFAFGPCFPRASRTFSFEARLRIDPTVRFSCFAIIAALSPDRASARSRSSCSGVQIGLATTLTHFPFALSLSSTRRRMAIARLAAVLMPHPNLGDALPKNGYALPNTGTKATTDRQRSANPASPWSAAFATSRSNRERARSNSR
jgi:hypothetical protein